jgi:hypothetical protein
MIEEMKKRVNDDGVDLVVDVGIHLTTFYLLNFLVATPFLYISSCTFSIVRISREIEYC